MTGRRDSRPRISLCGSSAPRHGDDGAQPRVPGRVRRQPARRARPAVARVPHRRRRVLRVDRVPQGRAPARRSHYDGVAHIRHGNPHARRRHGLRRPAALSRPRPHRHPQRHRRHAVGSCDRHISSGALRRAASCRTRRKSQGIGATHGPRTHAGRAAGRRREPTIVAEGHGPRAVRAARAARRAARSSRCSGAATPASNGRLQKPPAITPAASPHILAMRRISRTSSRRVRMSSSCLRASSPAG